jgi:cbb3-type cytochrome oxidase maturation protein
MIIIFFLIPLSVAMAAVFLFAFIWAVRSGQYEDTGTPSLRLLTDDPKTNKPQSNDSAPVGRGSCRAGGVASQMARQEPRPTVPRG